YGGNNKFDRSATRSTRADYHQGNNSGNEQEREGNGVREELTAYTLLDEHV
ncbi:hypothetical protein LTR53_000054, partial [Teratosphaeriaceae sp. CCFEE 6253]